MFRAAETWVSELRKMTESLGTADPFLYGNLAGGNQKPFCGYGPESVEFLKMIARKYDPAAVFQRLVPGGFKVSSAC